MPRTVLSTACLFAALCGATAVHGQELPANDAELDRLLCARSPKYKTMADAVRKRCPYRIVANDDFPLGNVKEEDGGLVIELNPRIPKARRATILIWEMANAYQRESFAEITRRALSGEIASHREYGIRMELVEHGSHQLHRDVLAELSRAGFHISRDFLFFLSSEWKSLDEYRIPSAHAYIEAQAKNRHTKHYESWYYRAKGLELPPEFQAIP